MTAEPQVSLHTPDLQHAADAARVVDGVADDVLNAQRADDAGEHVRREADRAHGPEEVGVQAAAASTTAASAQTDQVTDDHDYSGASTLERDTGRVERDAPPAEDEKGGDGSPESLVADAVDPPRDDHADAAATTTDVAAAPADDHAASAAPTEVHSTDHVDDGSAAG